jgi:hypothetical protein
MAPFGLRGKDSPPKNPRKPASNPRNAHHTDNSSHTPHNFFSFPLWKRNNAHTFTPTNPPPASDDFCDQSRRSSFNLGERSDSPPSVPPKDYTPSTVVPRILSVGNNYDNQEFVPGSSTTASAERTSPRRRPGPPRQSTVALAHASLGLGLPHVMPSQGASSSSLDITTLRNASNHRDDSDTGVARSIMRKAKSFQKLRPDPPGEDTQDPRQRRRSRGLSLGPLHFAPEGKGKERELESPVKGLSRKSSFWRRRKDSLKTLVHSEPQKSLPPVPNPPADAKGHVHLLPPLPLAGSDDRNTAPVPMPGRPPTPKHSPLLRRRSSFLQRSHSERMLSGIRPSSAHGLPRYTTSKSTEIVRVPGRPSTAGALPSSPRSSHLTPSISFSSITPQPITDRADSFPLDPSKPRARASTNPPLLHRLSMNLFLSSPPIPALPHTQLTSSPETSTVSSPRPSMSKQSVDIPRPRTDEESPGQYVDRLTEAVPKSDIATVLASR